MLDKNKLNHELRGIETFLKEQYPEQDEQTVVMLVLFELTLIELIRAGYDIPELLEHMTSAVNKHSDVTGFKMAHIAPSKKKGSH